MTNTIGTSPQNLAHIDRSDHVSPREIATGVVIGRTSEFFDFFVFAIGSVLVFPQLVFPFVDSLTGTLYSFALFALAFIARPIGSVLFMAIDRAYGRTVKLTVALFVLGTATVCVGFLPSYESIGMLAPIALIILRIGQGLALGGSWDGLSSLLAMTAPKEKRGWYAMVPQLGAPIGLIVASSLFAYFYGSLTPEDFFEWGWRYPFFAAFAINVVALFARLRIVDTADFKTLFDQRHLTPTTVNDTVKAQGKFIAVGALVPLASFALFHMVTVFPLSWVLLFTDKNPAEFLFIEVGSAVIGLLMIVASGFIADRFGRRNVLAACAVAIAIFSGLAPVLLNAQNGSEIIYMVLGFAILGLSFGQCSGAVASHFEAAYRYTGSALTSDLAWMFGAGFAPFVALFLSSSFGLPMAGLYLFSGAAATFIALLVNRQLARESEV